MAVSPTLETKDSVRRSAVAVSALGIFQILAWGSSYYLLAVLAAPISGETGWSLSLIAGGFSLSLLISGTAAPRVGRYIARHGGRPVLAAGCGMMAAGLTTLGLATSLTVFFAAWAMIGLAMSASLYDAAFSTLGRLYGARARQAITGLTLFGGFASTVCWPLSAYFVAAFGWREACFIYAAIHLLVSLPIILVLIPRESPKREDESSSRTRGPVLISGRERQLFVLLAAMLIVGGMIAALLSVHLLALLQAKGLALAAAVSLGALMGPSQVTARVVEMSFGRLYHPVWTMAASVALIACGIGLLLLDLPMLFAAIMFYGAGNGIGSIAKGTVPLAIFGPARYPVLMGRLAMPGLIAQALAPLLGAFVLERHGADGAIALLAALALANGVMVMALLMLRPRA